MKIAVISVLTILCVCSLYASENKITPRDQINKFSNLVWEIKKKSKLEEIRWEKASNYCKNLQLNDKKWRLPTFDELKSYKNSNANSIVQDDYYWSSTKNIHDKDEILIYDISNQNACEGLIKEDNYYVFCVRED